MKFNFRALSLVRPFLLVGIAALITWDITQVSWNSHQALNNLIDELHVGFIPILLLGCTRAIYSPKDGEFITVRSMDWSDPDMSLSLWLSPRPTADEPIERVGAGASLMPGEKALKWKPKYGSIVICNYGTATTDGMNEKGLVANALFLLKAGYGDKSRPETKKDLLAVSGWAQYVLDMYEIVEEAVQDLKDEPFRIFTDNIAVPDREGRKSYSIVLHLLISDAKGDSALFQYIDNQYLPDEDKNLNGYKLKVYHNPEDKVGTNSYKVGTNSSYDSQLDILKDFGKKSEQLPSSENAKDEINWDSPNNFSWDKVKSDYPPAQKDMNPPMNGSQIRFIRASFYSDKLEQISVDRKRYPNSAFQNVEAEGWTEQWPYEEGIARAFSLIRNMSTPLNVKSNVNPFLPSTLWRTVADQKNKRYFFESSRSIYPLYVDLLELLKGLDTFKKLDLYVSPESKGGSETNLQEDQMKRGIKMGKIDVSTFEKVDEWFKFDPEKPEEKES